jgi:hypothetical protein
LPAIGQQRERRDSGLDLPVDRHTAFAKSCGGARIRIRRVHDEDA